MTPNNNLEYYEKSDIAFMSFLMIWEPGSSGIEFFGKFQCYFPGGRRFWTPKRSGEVDLSFLNIFVIFENLYSHNKCVFWDNGGKVGGGRLSGDLPRLK